MGAHWVNLPGETYDGWLIVGKLPPEPFLHHGIYPGRVWDRARYGPPGTVWEFSTADVIERAVGIDPRGVGRILRWTLRKLKRVPGGAVPLFWVIPNSEPWEGPPLRYIHSTIVGTIGTDEGVAHTLNWRTHIENEDLTDQRIQDFAALLRDKWTDFLNSAGVQGAGNSMSSYFPPQLRYKEVRAAYIEQTTPDQKKPPYLIRTKYAPFAANVGGNGTVAALPYEVAHCLSLNTNFRGPRFRGRLYLGPLTQNWLGQEGQFDPAIARRAGAAFWVAVVQPMQDAGYELHVVSRKWVTSAQIIGVRAGLVPDSMRTRRKSRPETYQQVGGAALGSLPGA